MLINLKALSEAKIFKKKKNSGARATSQTTHQVKKHLKENISFYLGLISGIIYGIYKL
jgi:hypothetical protein